MAFRLTMTAEKVAEGEVGPIRAELLASGPALALFKPAVANRIVREALLAGGQFWGRVFLPQRFSPYAYRLGYQVGEKYERRKERLWGEATPFVLTGEWYGVALTQWRADATAKGGGGEIRIRIPVPHPTRPETQGAFRTVPTWEVERIGQEVGKALRAILSMTVVNADRQGRPQADRPIGPRPAAAPGSGRRAAPANLGRAA
jgi:hypothetical protein